MSRGPGRVSRAAFRFVQASERTIDACEVAAAVYAVEPREDGRVRLTPAQVVAVRRALAELVRRGEIRDMGRSSGGSGDGATPAMRRALATTPITARRSGAAGATLAPDTSGQVPG